jgi:hypothetical protein
VPRSRFAAGCADAIGVTFLAALLFVALVVCGLALGGAVLYYRRVLRPRLDAPAPTPEPAPDAVKDETDVLAAIVEQLNALARLRDQGVLTSKEFSSKKRELLERI